MEKEEYTIKPKKVILNHKFTFIWKCPKCGSENSIQSDWDSITDMCPQCENMFEIERE